MTLHHLIDAFAEKVIASVEPAGFEVVPPSLRLGPPSKLGESDWRVQPRKGIDWIAGVEAKLSAPLPPPFRSLVTRYVYPEFEAGGLWFFANTGEQTWQEWRDALWKDKALSNGLLGAGYVQFARPDTGNYDPICFDTQHRAKDGECPVVWIDHEGILCDDKIIVYREVAPSFVDFVRSYLEGP